MAGVIAVLYLVIINIIAFAVFGIDKRKAVHNEWRVKESTLFILAIIGGSVGALLGMHVFHHKTRKWYFAWGIPAILVIEAVIACLVLL